MEVVDVVCELAGDCPANCGDGARQLGLLRDDGKLILPTKNFTPFSGAAWELIDFCGKQVIADGLLTTNHDTTIMALQFVKEAPDGKWRRTNRFIPKWAAKNGFAPNGKEAKRWFAHDPEIKARFAETGRLGLGPAADKAYFDKLKKEDQITAKYVIMAVGILNLMKLPAIPGMDDFAASR